MVTDPMAMTQPNLKLPGGGATLLAPPRLLDCHPLYSQPFINDDLRTSQNSDQGAGALFQSRRILSNSRNAFTSNLAKDMVGPTLQNASQDDKVEKD